MAVEAKKVLTSGLAITVITEVEGSGLTTHIHYHGMPTKADTQEARELVDGVASMVGFESASDWDRETVQ